MELFLSVLCFFLSFLLCPLFMRLSPVLGAVDLPDGVRKRHARPTPRLGGMAFFSSFFLCSLLFLPAREETFSLLAFGLLLLFSGFLVDTRTLSARTKLLFQCLASGGALLACGVPRAISFFSYTLPLPRTISFLLFLFYTVAAINAVNFTDGADGLAAGCVLPSLLGLSLLFFSDGKDRVLLPLFLFFALLGFLPFNRAPARLFMGDAGSQFLGFALARFTLTGEVFPLSRLLFLALPLSDLAVTVVGRILRGKSPFLADRTHLHHRLAARGFSPSEILFFAASLSLAAAMLGGMFALL